MEGLAMLSGAPSGAHPLLWTQSGGSRSRTRFTTEEEAGNRGGGLVGEQANTRRPSGTGPERPAFRRLEEAKHASPGQRPGFPRHDRLKP